MFKKQKLEYLLFMCTNRTFDKTAMSETRVTAKTYNVNIKNYSFESTPTKTFLYIPNHLLYKTRVHLNMYKKN